MTKDTKKSKLTEMFPKFDNSNPTPEQRKQDILNLIRNRKSMAAEVFIKTVQQQMLYLNQSDMHKIVAEQFDISRQPTPEDLE